MAIHRHDNHKSANALMEWVDKRLYDLVDVGMIFGGRWCQLVGVDMGL